MSEVPVSARRGALTGVFIGALVLGAVLLTTAQTAAQDDVDACPVLDCPVMTNANPPLLVNVGPDTPSQDSGGTGVANVDPNTGEVTIVPDVPDNGIVEQSEPVGAYLVPADVIDLDSDGDGLYDRDEVNAFFTDPYTWDTDGDGVGDGEEVYLGTDPTA